MPTKAASKTAAKPRSTKTMVSLPRARKSKPLTLKGDTSKPGGQIIKGLFDAAGHTVVDTSSHADDSASYLNMLHGKHILAPAKHPFEHEMEAQYALPTTRADIDICQGRLDSHVDRIQELEARQATLNSTVTDVVQQFAALQFAHDGRDLCIGKLQTRVEAIDESVAGQLGKCRDQLKENDRSVSDMIAEERKYNVSRYALLHDKIEDLEKRITSTNELTHTVGNSVTKLFEKAISLRNMIAVVAAINVALFLILLMLR